MMENHHRINFHNNRTIQKIKLAKEEGEDAKNKQILPLIHEKYCGINQLVDNQTTQSMNWDNRQIHFINTKLKLLKESDISFKLYLPLPMLFSSAQMQLVFRFQTQMLTFFSLVFLALIEMKSVTFWLILQSKLTQWTGLFPAPHI